MKKSLKITLIAAAIAIIIAVCSIVAVSTYQKTPGYMLGLAERYLSELDYEQAIFYYEKYLEIEPKDSEAWLSLAEAYEGLGDTDKVAEVLERAVVEADSNKAAEKLKEIRNTETTITPAATSTPMTSTSPTTTTSPVTTTISEIITTVATTETLINNSEWLTDYTLSESDIELIDDQFCFISYGNRQVPPLFLEGDMTEELAIKFAFNPISGMIPYANNSRISPELRDIYDPLGKFTSVNGYGEILSMSAWGYNAAAVDKVLYDIFGIKATHKVNLEYFYYHDGYYYIPSLAAGGTAVSEFVGYSLTNDGRFIIEIDYAYNFADPEWNRYYILVSAHKTDGRICFRYHAIADNIRDITQDISIVQDFEATATTTTAATTTTVATTTTERETSSTDFEYTVENGEVIITAYIGDDTSIVIPSKIDGYPVTSIGENAFCARYSFITDSSYDCYHLTSVTIPDSVISIGDCAFFGCKNLTSITLSNGVTYIGEMAFGDCTNLTNITIPDSVTSIGERAFYRCESLTNIIIPVGVTSIGGGAFSYCDNLINITVNSDNASYTSIKGILFTKDKKTLVAYHASKPETSYIIPDSVTSIGDYAFFNCDNLKSITIPDSVTSIGYYAFSGCSALTKITIPDSVTSIGDDAFYNCANLKSITIPDSVTSIGGGAFSNCSSLTNIIIPNSVTSIGDYVFEYCKSLTKITIPDSVTSIDEGAFWGCESLSDVYYEGRKSDWNKIAIVEFGNIELLNATIHYNHG